MGTGNLHFQIVSTWWWAVDSGTTLEDHCYTILSSPLPSSRSGERLSYRISQIHWLCCHCQGSFPSFEGKLSKYKLDFLASGSKFETDQTLECNTSVEGFPRSPVGKESACGVGDPGSIPGLGPSPGDEMATHSSILENHRNRGAWQATIHGFAVVGRFSD